MRAARGSEEEVFTSALTAQLRHTMIRRYWSLVTAYFVTIATTLGTGILALPCKLAGAGLGPAILCLSVVAFMQVAVVYASGELINRTRLALHLQHQAGSAEDLALHGESSGTGISLPVMARLFLPKSSRGVFTFFASLHLVTILVSYALAGAFSLSQLVGIADYHEALIAPFIIVLATFTVAAGSRVLHFTSLATIFKLILILAMVGVVGVAAQVDPLSPSASYAAVLHPFLVSTVALGGVVNLLPVMSADVPASAAAWRAFLGAVVAAILTCFAINVLWASFILLLIPQTRAQAAALGISVSLEAAAEAGEPATIPLAALIVSRFPEFAWIGTAVSVFTSLSVSVSFIIMSTGLKSIIDGLLTRIGSSDASSNNRSGRIGGLFGLSISSAVEKKESDAAPLLVNISSPHGSNSRGGSGSRVPSPSNSPSRLASDEGADTSAPKGSRSTVAMRKTSGSGRGSTPTGDPDAPFAALSAVAASELAAAAPTPASASGSVGIGSGAGTGAHSHADLSLSLEAQMTVAHHNRTADATAASVIASLAMMEARLRQFLDDDDDDNEEEEAEKDGDRSAEGAGLQRSTSFLSDQHLEDDSSSHAAQTIARGTSSDDVVLADTSFAVDSANERAATVAVAEASALSSRQTGPGIAFCKTALAFLDSALDRLRHFARWLFGGLLRAVVWPVVVVYNTARRAMPSSPTAAAAASQSTTGTAAASASSCAPWSWVSATVQRKRMLAYVAAFSGVYLVAQADPKAFLAALELFTSLALNSSCGYFIAKMFVRARQLTSAAERASQWRKDKGLTGQGGAGEEEEASLLAASPGTATATTATPVKARAEEGPASTDVVVSTPASGSTSSAGSTSVLPFSLSPRTAAFVAPFLFLTFGAAIVLDLFEILARIMGWHAALWVGLAVLDSTLMQSHRKSLLKTIPFTFPSQRSEADWFCGCLKNGGFNLCLALASMASSGVASDPQTLVPALFALACNHAAVGVVLWARKRSAGNAPAPSMRRAAIAPLVLVALGAIFAVAAVSVAASEYALSDRSPFVGLTISTVVYFISQGFGACAARLVIAHL